MIDIGKLNGEPLLGSDSLADVLLAVLLCKLPERAQGVAKLVQRIQKLTPHEQADTMVKVLVLSKLRPKQTELREALKQMPLTIDSDILDDPWIRDLVEARGEEREKKGWTEGRTEGARRLLHRQLEQRFGPLPDWARQRLEEANSFELEAWSLRLLDAASLAETFSPS